jgi:uncharacterized membrane protein YtjA (UPF0391 family)
MVLTPTAALDAGLFALVGGPTPLLAGGSGLIELAVLFLVLALVSAVLGARGVAGMSMSIAKWLVIIFVVLAVVTFLL